jgi:hypothetical protein
MEYEGSHSEYSTLNRVHSTDAAWELGNGVSKLPVFPGEKAVSSFE